MTDERSSRREKSECRRENTSSSQQIETLRVHERKLGCDKTLIA